MTIKLSTAHHRLLLLLRVLLQEPGKGGIPDEGGRGRARRLRRRHGRASGQDGAPGREEERVVHLERFQHDYMNDDGIYGEEEAAVTEVSQKRTCILC